MKRNHRREKARHGPQVETNHGQITQRPVILVKQRAAPISEAVLLAKEQRGDEPTNSR